VNFSIVKSHPDILKYVVDLQRKNSNELGFLPRAAFEKGAEDGQLFLGLLSGQPCGYVLAGSGYRGVLRRWQICIEYGARRRMYGAMLVAAVEKYGEDRGCHTSVVHCASDLEANDFWQSVGYHPQGTVPCGIARRYKRDCLNVWIKALNPTVLVTEWRTGRPRIYATNADRQRAYRERQRGCYKSIPRYGRVPTGLTGLGGLPPATGELCGVVGPMLARSEGGRTAGGALRPSGSCTRLYGVDALSSLGEQKEVDKSLHFVLDKIVQIR